MNDARDDALAAVLDDSVRGIDPSPDERLTAIRRRGSARRAVRWVVVVTALAVSLGAVAWAGLALRKEASRPTGVTIGPVRKGWLTYEDARLGLALDHPASWQVMPVDTTCRVRFLGVLIASEPLELSDQGNDCTASVPSNDFSDPSENLVIVAITRWEGGPSPLPSGRQDTRFPVRLGGDFGQGFTVGLGFWPPSLGAFKELNAVMMPLVVRGDDRYAVRYFSAHNPSREDGFNASRIIGSIGHIDPCDGEPSPGPGLLSCEEAKQEVPYVSSAIDARLDWHQRQPGVALIRVWVFSFPEQVYHPHVPANYDGPPFCLKAPFETVVDARTGDFVVEGPVDQVRDTCPPPSA